MIKNVVQRKLFDPSPMRQTAKRQAEKREYKDLG